MKGTSLFKDWFPRKSYVFLESCELFKVYLQEVHSKNMLIVRKKVKFNEMIMSYSCGKWHSQINKQIRI